MSLKNLRWMLTVLHHCGWLAFPLSLLLEHAGFLGVEELHSLQIQDIPIYNDHMSANIPKQKNDQYREEHTIMTAKSGKSTCPVTTTSRILNYLESSSPFRPVARRIINPNPNPRSIYIVHWAFQWPELERTSDLIY